MLNEEVDFLEIADIFTEKDNVGFQWCAAVGAGGDGLYQVVFFFHRFQITALDTVEMMVVAMDLEHKPAAGMLVQVVDVLGVV